MITSLDTKIIILLLLLSGCTKTSKSSTTAYEIVIAAELDQYRSYTPVDPNPPTERFVSESSLLSIHDIAS